MGYNISIKAICSSKGCFIVSGNMQNTNTFLCIDALAGGASKSSISRDVELM